LSSNSFLLQKYNNLLDTQRKACFLTIGVGKGFSMSFSRAFNELSISFQKALNEPFKELFNEPFNELFKACSFFVLPCLVHAKKRINMQKGKGEMNKYPKTRL